MEVSLINLWTVYPYLCTKISFVFTRKKIIRIENKL